MRLMLYLIIFFLVIIIVRSFLRNFRSSFETQKTERPGFRTRSKYENVEEAQFKEIESHKKVNKEE